MADEQVIDPFEAAMELGDIRGRSPWEDAWHRLLKNRAAVVSAMIMGVMILMVLVGPMVISWEADFTDWDNTSAAPSFSTGHWFGTDAVGRDILVRTLEGGRISLLVGVVATLVSLVIGVTYGSIAGFYGGITEEILLRFGLITLLVWLLVKITRALEPTPTLMWIAIVGAAVIFGLGHLPATAALIALTPIVVLRAIVLNGIGGIIFGWLYWKRGLEMAIIAHFTTDLVIFIATPLLLSLITGT